MSLAIIADSTSDLPAAELEALHVTRVPLYVHFRGETFEDWVEITPSELIAGMRTGANPPTTSQPTPEDFAAAIRDAAADGATEALVISLSSTLSGTHQSATLAAKEAPIPVTVFDSRHASLGAGNMVKRAAAMRDAGASAAEVVRALEGMRERSMLQFTVATLDYLQKGGRIGRASALVGGLLNIKPILTIEDGVVEPSGRVRGAKKALREMVARLAAYRERHPRGDLVVTFIHIEGEEGVASLAEAIADAGIDFRDGGTYGLGAVIGVHVGPGTYGFYAVVDDDASLWLR